MLVLFLRRYTLAKSKYCNPFFGCLVISHLVRAGLGLARTTTTTIMCGVGLLATTTTLTIANRFVVSGKCRASNE